MLKVQLWTPDTCGCTFHLAHDPINGIDPYFVSYEEAEAIVEGLRRMEKKSRFDGLTNINSNPQPAAFTCEYHSHLIPPLHHTKSLEENVRKNQAITDLIDTIPPLSVLINGKDTIIPNPQSLGIDYRHMWAYDEDRLLHVSHTHLSQDTHQSLSMRSVVSDIQIHLDHTEFDWSACKFQG